ncbi:hypothetical protein HDU93_003127 [Gonapodya sp. JEL0774]|nr:hypothetical protein HDU93_003127 [Gonapodya sp. JEL0774]
MASEGTNAKLITAIENGSLAQVRAALRGGADVTVARKTVNLRVRVGGLFGATYEKRAPAEPVMALAVRSGNAEIVKELLDAGCDPNSELVWMIPNSCKKWTQQHWDRWRWLWTFEFTSALDLALTQGMIAFNRRGPSLSYRSPKGDGETHESFKLVPNMEVVQVLLSRGAEVDEAILEKARKLSVGRSQLGEVVEPNAEFLQKVEAAYLLQREMEMSMGDSGTYSPASATSSTLSRSSGDTFFVRNSLSIPRPSSKIEHKSFMSLRMDTSRDKDRASTLSTLNAEHGSVA